MKQPVITLLGRTDKPTDAVEEYCRYLGEALQDRGFLLEIHRVSWEIHGWPGALDALKLKAKHWCGNCVLIQYTALAWSARGFPQRVLRVLKVLKSAGVRLGVVFHDVRPFAGQRLVDFARRAMQRRTMRRVLSQAEFAIFTVPLEKISWLPTARSHATFIPVGPNLPIPSPAPISTRKDLPAVGVFSITGGQAGVHETELILGAVRHASQMLGALRLSVFGRHAELREAALRSGLKNLPVQLSVEGVAEAERIVRMLCSCDVLLFVRGSISSRRGSAIAGIACGLPVIAFSGAETASPITEAGVVLVAPGQADQLNAALLRVLSDREYWDALAARSRAAYETYFSWHSIAARFAEVLKKQLG